MALTKKKALPPPPGGIRPGHEVRDIVTGYTGIVTSKTEYINGCIRIGVLKSSLNKEGDLTPDVVFDIQQLEYLGEGVRAQITENTKSMHEAERGAAEEQVRTGGPRPLGSAAPRASVRR